MIDQEGLESSADFCNDTVAFAHHVCLCVHAVVCMQELFYDVSVCACAD